MSQHKHKKNTKHGVTRDVSAVEDISKLFQQSQNGTICLSNFVFEDSQISVTRNYTQI